MRFGSDICYFTILLHRSCPGLPRAFFVRYTRQAAAVLARADICRVTDSECSAGRAGQSTGLAGGLDYRTLFLSLYKQQKFIVIQ